MVHQKTANICPGRVVLSDYLQGTNKHPKMVQDLWSKSTRDSQPGSKSILVYHLVDQYIWMYCTNVHPWKLTYPLKSSAWKTF